MGLHTAIMLYSSRVLFKRSLLEDRNFIPHAAFARSSTARDRLVNSLKDQLHKLGIDLMAEQNEPHTKDFARKRLQSDRICLLVNY